MGGSDLLIVAGEASGDLHGARLLSELRKLRRDLRPFGLGGQGLREAGQEQVADIREVAVMGIVEVLRQLPKIRGVFKLLLDEVDRRGPKTAILIDFPDFNLRLARQLKRRGVQVIYYISPQVWAWRRGRTRTIARLVDFMLVLFPFELEFFQQHGLEVTHVGHPLVDEVPQAERTLGGPHSGEALRVVLLPGSRTVEVRALLPVMLGALHRIAQQREVRVSLVRAATIPTELVDELTGSQELPVDVVSKDRFAEISGSHLALCASGTATLEVGLVGTPLIVLYKLRPISYLLGKMLVDLPHVSLVNLVLGERVAPELIQGNANAIRLAEEIDRLTRSPSGLLAMRDKLKPLRSRLGRAGASRRAAESIDRFLLERI